jgi:hypothetical protein
MQIHHVRIQPGQVKDVFGETSQRQLQREHLPELPIIGSGRESLHRPLFQHGPRHHIRLHPLQYVPRQLMARFDPPTLHPAQPLVVVVDRVVVLDLQLGAPLLEDVQEGDRRRIVLHQTYLLRNRHHSRYGEMQKSPRRLLLLAQAMVQHPEELEDSLFASRINQSRIVHHQVGVDLAVVAADVEPSGGGVVLLDDVHARHKSRDAHVVVVVFGEEELSRDLHFGGPQGEVGQKSTFLLDQEGSTGRIVSFNVDQRALLDWIRVIRADL